MRQVSRSCGHWRLLLGRGLLRGMSDPRSTLPAYKPFASQSRAAAALL